MGLFNRLLGKHSRPAEASGPSSAPAAAATPWWVAEDEWRSWDAPLSIVAGESRYMPALLALAGPPRPEGWLVPVEAELLREPNNEHDGDAIAVLINGRKVGYIDAEACAELAEQLDGAGDNARLSGLPALIRGGRPGKPNLGVMLWLNHPDVASSFPGIDWDEMADQFTAPSWPPTADEGLHESPASAVVTGAEPLRERAPTTREPRLPPLKDHFTEYVDDVKELKRRGRLDDAEQLLLSLIDATEAEARTEGLGVAPWYYEQLAIVRRRVGDIPGEVEILERFARQPHSPGGSTPELLERLTRARSKLS